MQRPNATVVRSLIFVGSVALVAVWLFKMPYISPAAGDGKFSNISWRFPWETVGVPVAGYTIEFDHFDLSADCEATYEVKNLPSLTSNVGVYLCVFDPKHQFRSDESRSQLRASVDLEIADDAGKRMYHFSSSLRNLAWADPEGGANTYGLY